MTFRETLILVLESSDYEYDIYTLIKAFYPEKDIKVLYDDAGDAVDSTVFSLVCRENKYHFSVISKDGRIVAENISEKEDGDRITVKNCIKKLIYGTLSEYTGKKLPWGDLTGIRPVKIPMKLLEEGADEEAIKDYMRDEFFVSEKKARLALDIAKREKRILEGIDAGNGYSLYIGIPFCPSICLYCSFGSHPLEKYGNMTDAYLDALIKELSYISAKMKDRTLTSIYVGGGTPTSLDASQLDRLLGFVRKSFSCGALKEFTVEAGRPDTITDEKLDAIRKNGADRISVNPQTMNDVTLQTIGRNHTAKDIESAFALARKAGFDNINADIIAGLPGEGEKEVRYTLDRIAELSPESLTVHSLALKRATRLNLFKDEYMPVAFMNSESIMDMVAARAADMGLVPYYLYRQKNMAGNFENVGYAKDGCCGIYNILIMEEKQTIIAAGSGAVSKYVYSGGRIERTANVKDIHNYIDRIDEMIARKEKQISCS